MYYIPKIGDYLKVVTNNEVKEFLVINFDEYFNSTREKLNFNQVRNIILERCGTSNEVHKYAEAMQLSSFDNCVCHYNTKIRNLFDANLQLINATPIIKNKSNKLLSELKSLKF